MTEGHLSVKAMRDYLRGVLSPARRAAVDEHLRHCEECHRRLEALREVEAGKAAAQQVAMSPEAKLRLYERLNLEREAQGDRPVPIPRELIAQVKAKAAATAEAAQHVARATGEAAREIGTGGAAVAGQATKGAVKVGKRAVRTARSAAEAALEMGKEALGTAADLKRIAVDETGAVLRKAKEHPVDLAATPVRLAAKGMKAGGRMMEGAAKSAYAAARGGAKTAAGTAATMGTAAIEGAKTGVVAARNAPRIIGAVKKLSVGLVEGMQQVAEAKPEEAGPSDAEGGK